MKKTFFLLIVASIAILPLASCDSSSSPKLSDDEANLVYKIVLDTENRASEEVGVTQSETKTYDNGTLTFAGILGVSGKSNDYTLTFTDFTPKASNTDSAGISNGKKVVLKSGTFTWKNDAGKWSFEKVEVDSIIYENFVYIQSDDHFEIDGNQYNIK